MADRFEFHLKIIGPEFSREFLVPLGESILGRDPGCDVQLPFPLVSRRHARLTCTEQDCQIEDLESANGTIVNNIRLTSGVPVSFTDQAYIQIGPFEITVHQVAVSEPVVKAEVRQEPERVSPEPPLDEVSSHELPEPEKDQAPPPKREKKPAKAEVAAGIAKPAPEKRAPYSSMAAEPQLEILPAQPPPAPVRLSQEELLDGLFLESKQLIHFLPGIYHTDWMSRFLALFESILTPLQWMVDNFDIYLDPGTAPESFLPWLAGWYEILFDSTWSEEQRRTLLKEAHWIYARRGTRRALSRVLEIYTGHIPEIKEYADERQPFTFTIRLPVKKGVLDRELIEKIVDASKPAHTTYQLEFTE